MLTQEKINRLAEIAIPDKVHPYLHINCQEAWVSVVANLIKEKQIQPKNYNLLLLVKHWEIVLLNYYSTQN